MVIAQEKLSEQTAACYACGNVRRGFYCGAPSAGCLRWTCWKHHGYTSPWDPDRHFCEPCLRERGQGPLG